MLDEEGGLKSWFGDGFKKRKGLDGGYKRKRDIKDLLRAGAVNKILDDI